MSDDVVKLIEDHERIWLQNKKDVDSAFGRSWCQDKVWPENEKQSEPTEYVRADLYHALTAQLAERDREIERLREENKTMKPWVLFYRDKKSLGEIAEECGGDVYTYSPWLYQAALKENA